MCHWNGNKVSKLKYGPIFLVDHKSLLLSWVNPAWITIPLNTTLLVLPSSPVILNLAETLPDQCVLNALAHTYCFNLSVMAHKRHQGWWQYEQQIRQVCPQGYRA